MVPNEMFPSTSMPDRDWWMALWPDPAAILFSLGVRPDMTALDLCCGDGYFTAPLARIAEGRLYALDLDPVMIERARLETRLQGASVRRWITGDASQVAELIPEPLDFVLIANTFHGVPDQQGLAGFVAKVLKPGGLFAIVNWHALPREETKVLDQPRGPKTEMRMSPDAVGSVVEPAGFYAAHVVELPPYHYGAVFERRP